MATDVATYLPPETLSGLVFLSGVPATTGIAGDLVPSALLSAVAALTSNDNVVAYQAAMIQFADKLFAHHEQVPFAVKALHRGHSLSPDIMRFMLNRPMDVSHLWKAGAD